MKKKPFFLSDSKIAIIGTLVLLTLAFFACSKDDDNNQPQEPDNSMLHFEGTAKPSSESVNTTATGSLTATYDPETKKLSYTFTWDGLSGEIGGFHIHNGAGAIIINFKDDDYATAIKGSFSGSSTLTDDSWITDLEAGKLYGQIHTAKYPAGEIIFPFAKKSGSPAGNNNDNGGSGDGNDNPYVY